MKFFKSRADLGTSMPLLQWVKQNNDGSLKIPRVNTRFNFMEDIHSFIVKQMGVADNSDKVNKKNHINIYNYIQKWVYFECYLNRLTYIYKKQFLLQ